MVRGMETTRQNPRVTVRCLESGVLRSYMEQPRGRVNYRRALSRMSYLGAGKRASLFLFICVCLEKYQKDWGMSLCRESFSSMQKALCSIASLV